MASEDIVAIVIQASVVFRTCNARIFMKRRTIIGLSGAGKSTLARELGHIFNIKVYHLDRIFWERFWKGKPEETRMDILQKIVGEEQWIIEGSYFSLIEPRFEKADTIIFLDMPPLLCLYRLFKRHWKQRGHSRRDIPIDSTDKFDLKLILKVLFFTFHDRISLQQKLARYEETKRIIHLRSPEEVARFLAEEQASIERTTHDHVPMYSASQVKKSQPTPVLSSQ